MTGQKQSPNVADLHHQVEMLVARIEELEETHLADPGPHGDLGVFEAEHHHREEEGGGERYDPPWWVTRRNLGISGKHLDTIVVLPKGAGVIEFLRFIACAVRTLIQLAKENLDVSKEILAEIQQDARGKTKS